MGAALLNNPERIREVGGIIHMCCIPLLVQILTTLVAGVSTIPVTCKIRILPSVSTTDLDVLYVCVT